MPVRQIVTVAACLALAASVPAQTIRERIADRVSEARDPDQPLVETDAGILPPEAYDNVEVMEVDWVDADRSREVPARIYLPERQDAAAPVIIFSHGLGGTRNGYEYLGRHWAQNGFVSVHIQHVGSDDSIWRNNPRPMQAMREATSNLDESVNRPRDISFALDQLELMNASSGELEGRLDLGRVGVAGHSYGAYTVLAASGRTLGAGSWAKDLSDPRVDACIAMSPPSKTLDVARDLYTSYAVPTFHMTGTLDDSPVGQSSVETRRVPFDAIDGPPQVLMTLVGGDHMVFSGRPRRASDRGDSTSTESAVSPAPSAAPGLARGGSNRAAARVTRMPGWDGDPALDPVFQEIILRSSTAYWRAMLLGDDDARAWFAGDGLETLAGEYAVVEKKGF